MDKQIQLYGVAHWSTQGEIEGKLEYWNWGLKVDEEEIPPEQMLERGTEEALNFYREIKPHFPEDPRNRMHAPMHIPGPEGWTFYVSLTEFREPEKARKILENYFPQTFEE